MSAHRQNIVKLFRSMGYRHDAYRLFADFCELAALSLANAVDLAQREAREARYLEIVKGYTREETYRRTRAPVELAVTLIPEAYTSREFYEIEQERVFTTGWVAVGFVTDVDRRRSFTAVDINDLRLRQRLHGL